MAKKQAERELIEREDRFRQLVECAPDAIFVQLDYHFAYVNAKTAEMFGARVKSVYGSCVSVIDDCTSTAVAAR